MPFNNNKPDCSRDLTVLISSISSFDIISVVIPDPKILLWIAAPATDAVVNPNGIKTYLAHALTTFFIKDNLVFSNGPRCLSGNPPDCIILGN